jgi:hypothetical protein
MDDTSPDPKQTGDYHRSGPCFGARGASGVGPKALMCVICRLHILEAACAAPLTYRPKTQSELAGERLVQGLSGGDAYLQLLVSERYALARWC